MLYQTFDRFELEDISLLNRVSRHIEHSELTDEQIAKLEGCKYQAVQCSVKAGDGTPVYTAAQARKKRTCKCLEKEIRNCKCNRIYHQPDCDTGWDSRRNRYCGDQLSGDEVLDYAEIRINTGPVQSDYIKLVQILFFIVCILGLKPSPSRRNL